MTTILTNLCVFLIIHDHARLILMIPLNCEMKNDKVLFYYFYAQLTCLGYVLSFLARAVRDGFGGGKFFSKQGPVNGPSLRFEYHNYDDMTSYLRNVNSMFPNITALYSIGKSVQGTESTFNTLTKIGN